MRKYYYQLVSQYGKYDIEYVLHQARRGYKNQIEILPIPFILVGNHPQEIRDTLLAIMKDIKNNPPVDKKDCLIFHENLQFEDEENFEEDNLRDEQLEDELTREYQIHQGEDI